MGLQFVPCGHGQQAILTGRNNNWSKHAKFNKYGDYVGQHTKKQTNKKRRADA